MSNERCFACGRPLRYRLGTQPACADTRDDQIVYVGTECAKLVKAAGENGYQPPKGGPKLYPMSAESYR